MTDLDLFGQPVVDTPRPNECAGGYAGKPGYLGPPGETCRSCVNAVRVEIRSGSRFWKCALMRAHWTGSYGSDIRLKSPACRFWKAVERAAKEATGA